MSSLGHFFLSGAFLLAHLSQCLASPAVTCRSLSSTLPGKVFYPGSDAYNSSINSYTYVNDRILPACIVGPRSTGDVVSSVTILGKYPSTHFAIRGGGHSFNANFSNTAGGVTIDMRAIKAVTVNEGQDTVSVGAGALWRDVYAVTDARNISVLGGRVATVGVAGLTTGGGISYFSPERGWVCDGVANFEIVLSSGKLVNANATSNPDLFAALKGGQNNFGLVTRFDLKAFAIKPFWGGTISYTNSTDDAILAAFAKFKTAENFDPAMEIVQNMAYDSSTGTFNGITAIYYTTGEANPKQLEFYTDIKPQLSNSMRLSKPSDFAQELESFGVPDEYILAAVTSFHASPTAIQEAHAKWKDWVLKIGAITNLTAVLNLQSTPPPPRNPDTPNSLGFPPSSHPELDLVPFELNVNYKDPSATGALTKEIKSFIEEMDRPTGFKYMNYAGWFQDPIKAYGTVQVQKLRTVSHKYDPIQMFQKQVVGGFKLW